MEYSHLQADLQLLPFNPRNHAGEFTKVWYFSDTPEEEKKWIDILIFSLFWLGSSDNSKIFY